MLKSLLPHLRCPISGQLLSIQIISEKEKGFIDGPQIEIVSGLLLSEAGLVYPIINGVPRLLLESFIEHENFIASNLPGFDNLKKEVMKKFGNIILDAQKRNRPTKKSFSLEWSLLKNKDVEKIWGLNKDDFRKQLFLEIAKPDDFFENKFAIDVGCGHGRSSNLLAGKCGMVIGLDLSESVEWAHESNLLKNCFFIQADLRHLPLGGEYFDIVYSSGVLHHTENTKNSFDSVERLTKYGGIFCIWLYKSFDNKFQKGILGLRSLTRHLPLKLQYYLYLIFLVPAHKLVAIVKGNNRSWREIMISQLDVLSPEYRHEHRPEEILGWFKNAGFIDAELTTENNLGFSVRGTRSY